MKRGKKLRNMFLSNWNIKAFTIIILCRLRLFIDISYGNLDSIKENEVNKVNKLCTEKDIDAFFRYIRKSYKNVYLILEI